MTDWTRVAAAVLAKCATKDPFFPKPSPALATGWGEEFKDWNLTPDDLLAGVTRAYHDHGSGFRPLPKDIVDAARAIRRERDAKTGPTPEYQELCESKFISYEEALQRIRARTGQKAIGHDGRLSGNLASGGEFNA
jgi:hypothetical protein